MSVADSKALSMKVKKSAVIQKYIQHSITSDHMVYGLIFLTELRTSKDIKPLKHTLMDVSLCQDEILVQCKIVF